MNDNQTIQKAFENMKFLKSREGRTVRILSEYLHPEQYLRKNGIYNTIVFFGSARSISTSEYNERMETLLTLKEQGQDISIDMEIEKLKKLKFTTKYYDATVELAEKIANWSKELPNDKRFYICTGGGPGMMEAANRGANNAKTANIGYNISLPFEQQPNPYISPELNFEFHYFFMRKFWFVYHAKAIVVMPGGFGTLDELMELLTLEQTNIMSKKVPIVLFGSEYWNNLINFQYLKEIGMISEEDLDLFIIMDDIDLAFKYLKKSLSKLMHINYENNNNDENYNTSN